MDIQQKDINSNSHLIGSENDGNYATMTNGRATLTVLRGGGYLGTIRPIRAPYNPYEELKVLIRASKGPYRSYCTQIAPPSLSVQ